ncbi:hypothetical protein, partial [Serratia marcescens]|uniref:hypothetical protein n=1 Tax=Serratia marcescens TaxID=615 RepID=UPI001952E02F
SQESSIALPMGSVHNTDSIQAAINGEGVALGWALLLSRLLAEGRLVMVGRTSLVPEDRDLE